MSIYYGDMEGVYPANATALTIAGKYLTVLPNAKAPNYHADSSQVTLLGATATPVADGVGWYYMAEATNANVGNVLVNCTHTDTKGSIWSAY
jgi:hypothetical protein